MTDSLTTYFADRAVADPSRYGVTETEAGFRIPVYSLFTGEEVGYEVRLREPGEDGRKFTRPKGQSPSLNFAPEMRTRILDPKQTLVIVEGSTRHMALASAGVPAVSMQGCYGWRASATAVLPEFDYIPLKGRKVVIALDGDVASKVEVNEALRRLAQFLTQKGASDILWVDLPIGSGLDDWLAAGGTPIDLPGMFRSMDLLPEIERQKLSRARMAEKKGLPDTTDEALAELWVLSDPTHAVRVQGTDSWYTYVSGRWIADRTRDGLDARSSLAALLTQTAERFMESAETDSEKRVAADAYRDLRSAGKLGAVYSRFKALPASMVTVEDDDFDRDPYLFNVANGTLDLRTGSLRGHDASDRLRGLCPTEYVADANAPRWLRFLSEVFPGRQDVVDYLQLILGASLIGRPILHILPVFVGSGRNGKGTLIRALTHALGRDYMAACDNSLLISSQFEKHSTNVMALKGRRIVHASETEAGDAFATAALKRYTGGDELSARRMREDETTFTPTHSMILQTNHLPKVDVEDEALWARLRLIHFTQSFMDAPEPDLDAKLAAEREGILAWLVAGAARFISGGMVEGRIPDSIQGATTTWRVSDDQFGQFAEENLILDPKGRLTASDLQEKYRRWCEERGERMEYQGRKWGAALTKYGAVKGRTNSVNLWTGISFRSESITAAESITESITSSEPRLTSGNTTSSDACDGSDGNFTTLSSLEEISSPSPATPIEGVVSRIPSLPSLPASSQVTASEDAPGSITDSDTGDGCPECGVDAWIDGGYYRQCQSCNRVEDR